MDVPLHRPREGWQGTGHNPRTASSASGVTMINEPPIRPHDAHEPFSPGPLQIQSGGPRAAASPTHSLSRGEKRARPAHTHVVHRPKCPCPAHRLERPRDSISSLIEITDLHCRGARLVPVVRDVRIRARSVAVDGELCVPDALRSDSDVALRDEGYGIARTHCGDATSTDSMQ